MRLLAIDTATEHCSAALWMDGPGPQRIAPLMRGNGELVLTLVDELLSQAGLSLQQLDAIAFGRGPGSFTGVRFAASTAQGLAFAADLPVIPVSNLRALAQQVLMLPGAPGRALICQDARMNECYWAGFECEAGLAALRTAEAVSAPAEIFRSGRNWWQNNCWAAGSGFAVFPQLGMTQGQSFGCIVPEVLSRAADVAWLAAHDGLRAAVAPADALPVYLRDQVAVVPSH